MIYRITEPATWDTAQVIGVFASADLAAEGFIHCCTRQQLNGVASRYYQGQTGLLLLTIDETLLEASLRWEDVRQSGEVFPHVYGPIPLAAVRCCRPLKAEDN